MGLSPLCKNVFIGSPLPPKKGMIAALNLLTLNVGTLKLSFIHLFLFYIIEAAISGHIALCFCHDVVESSHTYGIAPNILDKKQLSARG